MQLKVVIHEVEEGGFWAVVPSLPGCATRGDSLEELLQNLRDAVAGRSSAGIDRSGRFRRPAIVGLDNPL